MKTNTRTWNALGTTIVVAWFAAVGGCTNPGTRDDSATGSVFVFTRADLEAKIGACRNKVTKDCRNELIHVVRAHVDAEQLQGSENRDWWSKIFALATLGGTTATTRVSGETAKTNVSTGLAVLTGVRQIFDVGEDVVSGVHPSDVWERIVARMNLPCPQYPLEAALADLEEYRVANARK